MHVSKSTWVKNDTSCLQEEIGYGLAVGRSGVAGGMLSSCRRLLWYRGLMSGFFDAP